MSAEAKSRKVVTPGLTLKKIATLELTSAADAVTDALRKAIVYGHLPPGERILQTRVAEELGVSRQPVREALARLQAEGLVISLLGGGCAVCEPNLDHVRENYRLRALLEGEAAGDAAKRITSTQLEDLQRTNARMQFDHKRGSFDDWLDLNRHFHGVIWLASGLPTVSRILDEIWASITVAAPLIVPHRMKKSVTEHDRIIQAMSNGDGELAAEAMRQHIREAAEDFEHSQLPESLSTTTRRRVASHELSLGEERRDA